MARTQTRKLDSGDAFPDFRVSVLDNAETSIRSQLSGSWSVLLFYRGHW